MPSALALPLGCVSAAGPWRLFPLLLCTQLLPLGDLSDICPEASVVRGSTPVAGGNSAFQTYSLVFSSLMLTGLRILFSHVYRAWDSLTLLDLWVCHFHQFWNVFGHPWNGLSVLPLCFWELQLHTFLSVCRQRGSPGVCFGFAPQSPSLCWSLNSSCCVLKFILSFPLQFAVCSWCYSVKFSCFLSPEFPFGPSFYLLLYSVLTFYFRSLGTFVMAVRRFPPENPIISVTSGSVHIGFSLGSGSQVLAFSHG